MELPLLYHDLTHSRKPSAVKVPAYLADLQLDTLLQAMAGNDPVIYSLCLEIMIHPLTDTKEIYLRQAVLQDAIRISSSFRFIYARALHAIEQAAEHRMGRDPIHDRGLSVTKRLILESETGLILLDALQQIRQHLIEINDSIHSARLSSYVNEQLQQFLPTFFTSTKTHLEQMVSLKDTGGIVIHCKFGQGLKLDSVMLCQILDGPENPEVSKTTHVRRHLFKRKSKDNNRPFVIGLDTTTKGHNASEAMEGVLVHVLRRVNDFNRSVLEVLTAMRDQFGFYTGCLNLYDALRAVKAPVCFPELDAAPGTFLLHQLSDVFLALKQGKMPVTNDVNLNGIRLCLIMGSNQGGKTTFLRSVGIAQIMAQSGLFVAAMDFHTSIYPVILTHFPGSEDSMLKAGLLEQELTALADRIDHLQQGSLLLLNETFATTTVGEGSILAEEVTRALRDAGVISLFVTHLYPFARRLYEARGSNPDVAFLRAERLNDGLRTYRLRQGEPLATSYGYDLYDHQLSDLFN